MAVNNDNEGRTPQTWLSRLELERQHLSASVQETLNESSFRDPLQNDESESVMHMPALEADSHDGSPAQTGKGGKIRFGLSRQTHRLIQFAQRLTSSLVALSSVGKPGDAEESKRQELNRGLPAATMRDIPTVPTTLPIFNNVPPLYPPPTRTGIPVAPLQGRDTGTTPMSLSTPQPVVPSTRPRLAGSSTRVRLQTPPVTPKVADSNDKSTRVLSAIEKINEAEEPTEPQLPAITPLRRGTEVGVIWSSGMFECGQREAIISCPYVTAGSVVMATLTSNPGPVVVQYVSLQPQTSFTVHLTAPTTVRTFFNYMLLVPYAEMDRKTDPSLVPGMKKVTRQVETPGINKAFSARSIN